MSQDPVFMELGTAEKKQTTSSLKDPQNLNAYAYARNNPVRYNDPSGKCIEDACIVEGAIAVAAVSEVVAEAPAISAETQAAAYGLGTTLSQWGNAALEAVDNRASAGKTAVYNAVDDAGRTVYVGITNNLERRAAEHAVTKGITINGISGLSNLTRQVARGAEQALIESYGMEKNGGTLLNKINSIAPSNPSYQGLVTQGRNLIQSIFKK